MIFVDLPDALAEPGYFQVDALDPDDLRALTETTHSTRTGSGRVFESVVIRVERERAGLLLTEEVNSSEADRLRGSSRHRTPRADRLQPWCCPGGALETLRRSAASTYRRDLGSGRDVFRWGEGI